jgi:hypothetical protein
LNLSSTVKFMLERLQERKRHFFLHSCCSSCCRCCCCFWSRSYEILRMNRYVTHKELLL